MIVGDGGAAVRAAVGRGATVGDAVTWARDMVNTPSKEKSPADMVTAARKLLRGRGITVQVLDVKQLRSAAARRRARGRAGLGADRRASSR